MGCKCKDKVIAKVKTVVDEVKVVATVANVTISDIMKKIYGDK